MALEGVGYPMATAIVSFLAPRAFPIMDKWTVRAGFGEVPASLWQRARVYATFTQQLCNLAPVHFAACGTIHDVDVAIMRAMIGCDEPRSDCRHVVFEAVAL